MIVAHHRPECAWATTHGIHCIVSYFIVTERHTPKYTQNELIRYDIWWINKSSYGSQQQRLTGENHFGTHIFATQSLWIIDKINACIAIHTHRHRHTHSLSSLCQLEDRKKWFPRIFPSVSPFHNNLFCLMTAIHLHTWSDLSPTTHKLSWAITISQRKYENKAKKKPANRRWERREKSESSTYEGWKYPWHWLYYIYNMRTQWLRWWWLWMMITYNDSNDWISVTLFQHAETFRHVSIFWGERAFVLGCIQRLSLAKQSTFSSPMTHIRMISNRTSGFWKIVFSNTCMWQAVCIGDVSFPT